MTLFEIKMVTGSVNRHWKERMPLMAAEEAAEFIQAVSKLERKLYAREELADNSINVDTEMDNLIEEMADTMIVIGALMNRYGIDAEDIIDALCDKLLQERTM